MKISTKGRYALDVMLDLAVYGSGRPISIRDIAARLELSDKYLESIIAQLNKAGYVRSVRGAQGGYLLQREPASYTVGSILRECEGGLWPVSGLTEEEARADQHHVTNRVYLMLYEAIEEVVERITLADLVEWRQQAAGDYYVI